MTLLCAVNCARGVVNSYVTSPTFLNMSFFSMPNCVIIQSWVVCVYLFKSYCVCAVGGGGRYKKRGNKDECKKKRKRTEEKS